MYKVFFNEKLILLASEGVSGKVSVKYADNSSIDLVINELKSDDIDEIVLFNDNLIKLWTDFKAYFKIIEAAGGLVRNQNNEYLFIFRLNKWDLPKGKMEIGESKEESAKREIEEECNIEPILLEKELTTTYHIYYLENKPILKITYWYLAYYEGNNKLIPQTEEGIEKVVWVKETEIPELLENSYGNIRLLVNSYINN